MAARPAEQSNLSDPDSRLMRRSKAHEDRQAYHAQAGVDAGGSRLILGARISQGAGDRNELVAGVEAVPDAVGVPATVLADNGYANGGAVESLAARGMEVLVATGAQGRRRRYDCRPSSPVGPPGAPQASTVAWATVFGLLLADRTPPGAMTTPSR